MAVKPPSKVSLSWWKKNYPNSMPTNKEVEKHLGVAEAGPAKLGAKIIKIAEKETDLKKLGDSIESRLPYKALLEELKRAKVTVTKEKHTDLVKAIDVLIDLVRKDRVALGELIKPSLERGKPAPNSNSKAAEKLEAMLDGKYSTILKRSGAWATRAMGDAAKAADAPEIAMLIGRNRFVQKYVKDTIAQLKKSVDGAKLDTKIIGEAEIRLKSIGLINSLKKT